VDIREILNAIFYWADNGCKWDALPHDLPPRSTVHGHFSKWVKKGIWQRLNDQLRKQVHILSTSAPYSHELRHPTQGLVSR
jgi:putative transposase